MKQLAYIASLLILLCSCSEDLEDTVGTKVPDGTPIEIMAAAEFPELNIGADSRAFVDQPTADELRNRLKVNILVFDAAGVMLQYIQPKDIAITDIDVANQTVHLKVSNIYSSSQKRRLHFVVTSADLLTLEGGAYISSMANEKTVMPALMTSNDTDVYWGLNEVVEIKAGMSLEVKAIRNFVKLRVENGASGFTMDGYTVVNRPSKGTVAPYNYEDQTFASFLASDNTLQSYDEIIAQGYHGVNPAGADANMSCTTAAEVEAELSLTPCYFYERSQSTTATVGGATMTYVIVKGVHNGQTYYYKIDLGHNVEGDFKFYDLLRNFEYTITITEVGGPGAATLEEAMKGVAHNNLSASTVTRDLFSINYQGDKIEVSSTRIIFTEQTTDYELKFRYTVGKSNSEGFIASKLQIYDMSSDAQTHYNMGDFSTWDSGNLTGEVAKSTSIKSDENGWYTLHINTHDLPADGRRRQQMLRIYYSGGETNLSRTVELILCEPWKLENVSNSLVPTAVSGSDCEITFTLPSDLASTQFPLILTFESDKQNIYAEQGSDMTVAVGKSDFKGATTDNVIKYELSIPYADYNAQDKDGKYIKRTITAKFLMNTAVEEDQDYDTSGIDSNTTVTTTNKREANNGESQFCIRIANKGMKCIEPHYVNITRTN